jgi:hypothetical protein
VAALHLVQHARQVVGHEQTLPGGAEIGGYAPMSVIDPVGGALPKTDIPSALAGGRDQRILDIPREDVGLSSLAARVSAPRRHWVGGRSAHARRRPAPR